MAIQLGSLLERNFALFSWNFSSNYSSEFLLLADSDGLDSKLRLGTHLKIRGSYLYEVYRMAALKKFKMLKEMSENL